ncbi:MAG: fibronectin type III domain-containing protein, partial [Crocinitomicaceae bacterium]|nr:fibronectin type III domain-containing protein [Crocinitomicaceae bacterium]
MTHLFTHFNHTALKLAFVVSLLLGWNASAQNYPVQTSIATTGPYLNYLSYYGDHNNHLQITITNTSFNSPTLAVRLRLRIEGSGWELYTNPNATIGQPFIIEPGMPVTISGIELLPYLQANNLINPDGVDLNNLPKGFTNICVDIINESAQQQVLSTNNCGFLPIQEYQPPQAFVPTCGEQLDTSSMFQNFTWTPPVPFPAGADIEVFYDFSIRHWIDPNNNSALAGNSILVYEELDLIAPTTQVSDFDVQWEMGGTYVWTVTARVQSNGIPLNLINNNGVSAPCTFVYGEELSLADQLADGLEIELFTSPTSEYKGKAWWTVTDYTPNQGLSNFDEFYVEFRRQPTGNEGYQVPWFYKTVTSFEHFLYQLEPSTTYEVKVSGVIAGVVGDPTPVKTFTTPEERVYNCGDSDLPFLPSTYTPLENATVGTQVQIGQFMMTLTEVNEIGGGHYAGKGTVPIAFLAGAKAKVRFDDILIDTEYRVHEGRVDVVTKGLENWLNEQYQAFIDPYYVDGVIDSAWVDSTAGVAWVMVDGNPQSFPFDPPNAPVIVNDENGNQYTIYPNGTIVVGTYLSISETWTATADEVIHFSQNEGEARGFDPKEHMEWYENYEVMMLGDSSKYFVANKSLAKGEGDLVNVEIPAGANVSFQFSDGTDVTDVNLQGNWIGTNEHTNSTQRTLNIPARSNAGNYSIYAMVNNQKVGQLNVRVYSEKTKELVVVPIANSSLTKAQIEAELDKTLGEANIDVNVTVDSVWVDTSGTFTATTNISLPSEVGLLTKSRVTMRVY